MAKIYISSTYVDLKKEREAAAQAIRRLEEHQAIAMEDYVASDQRPVDKCLQDVNSCDVYVGIFAWRYGFIPAGYDKSITHLEYEAARKAGIPRLIFLLVLVVLSVFLFNRLMPGDKHQGQKQEQEQVKIDVPVETSGQSEKKIEDSKETAVEKIAKKVYKNEKGFMEADYGDGIKMVYIPAGTFTMGSNDDDDEKPPHEVFLDGYWLGKTEVTVGQYKAFISDTGHESLSASVSKYSPSDNHPVVYVSWDNAVAYCKWLSNKKGLSFKLPTEAQWEKAARGTNSKKYPWGDHDPYYNKKYYANYDPGNYEEDGYRYNAPVGSYPQGASPYGLLDMAGNVWEWCYDWYGPYNLGYQKNPTGPKSGADRVLRGGSWGGHAVPLRCSYRLGGKALQSLQRRWLPPLPG